jgi:transcriptional regulator with XRE-family HTH domain
MNRVEFADFLRKRRMALQPADVGYPVGARRRTSGLRREEVALLCGMSTDYYARLEQQRGPQPSDQMLAAIARGLRLTLDERDHLFRLADRSAPTRRRVIDHVAPALMRMLDRLEDTPAQVMNDLGETLAQNRMAVALLGDQTSFTGLAKSAVFRWFTDPSDRRTYREDDHEGHGRFQIAALRASLAGPDAHPRARGLVTRLLAESSEFAALWNLHEVAIHSEHRKCIIHNQVGPIHVDCQVLFTENRSQSLLVFTATPGSADYDKLQLLSAIGTQPLGPPDAEVLGGLKSG